MSGPARRLVAVVTAGLLVLTACGSAKGTGKGTGSGTGGQPVTVFAAASLTEAFNAAKQQLLTDGSTLNPVFSFGGSQQLVSQIEAGAPADVVATADEPSMAKLVEAGLVDDPVIFATNRLELVVAPGNPNEVRSLADLSRGDLIVVLADPSVPAGKYAAQVLRTAGVVVKPKSLELNVKAALQKVAGGEADAAIVYATDVVSAGKAVEGVPLGAADNVTARYPIATVKKAFHREAAGRFVAEILRGAGKKALQDKGFGAP